MTREQLTLCKEGLLTLIKDRYTLSDDPRKVLEKVEKIVSAYEAVEAELQALQDDTIY